MKTLREEFKKILKAPLDGLCGDELLNRDIDRMFSLLQERVGELKVPSDWNKGDKTEKRYDEILYKRGNVMEVYNEVLDSVIELFK